MEAYGCACKKKEKKEMTVRRKIRKKEAVQIKVAPEIKAVIPEKKTKKKK